MSITLNVTKIENLKTLKYHIFLKKKLVSIVCNKYVVKMKKYLKKKNRLRY